jgi:hypothetical protein
MSKQGLGNGLGALMGRASKQEAVPAEQPQPEAAPFGAGVRSLLRGNNPEAIRAPTEAIPAPPKPALPRWYLFAGDVLLVTLALLTLGFSPHPLSWQRELFCTALVILAAVLAVAALLMPNGKSNP